jgi:putative transposase
VVAYIEACRGQFGVEPVCRVLRQAGVAISPSAYYAARARPPSARAVRDAALEKQILRVYKDSGERYGAWKVWDQLNREGIAVARCTVERLMRTLGLRGVRRGGYKVRTTRCDPSQPRPADLVNRDFAPDAPDRLWVVDFTFVATWAGTAYTAFVIDAFSRLIAGWRTAAHHSTGLVLDALVMAVAYRARQGVKVAGLIHHSDAGSEGGFNRSLQHLQVEVGEWGDHAGGQLRGRGGRRCVRRVGLRWPGGRTGSGSGWRSPGECRVRTPALRLVCPRQLVRDGSVTAAGSGRSAWRRFRGGTCRWRSGRRSRSCGSGGAVSARSPGVSAGRRRRSRGSCAGTPRPGAAGWSTGL